jgi:hypothetical protein
MRLVCRVIKSEAGLGLFDECRSPNPSLVCKDRRGPAMNGSDFFFACLGVACMIYPLACVDKIEGAST